MNAKQKKICTSFDEVPEQPAELEISPEIIRMQLEEQKNQMPQMNDSYSAPA